MGRDGFLVRLDQLSSSYLVLLFLAGVGLVAGCLLFIGLIGWAVGVFGQFVRQSIRQGFRLWERLFSWATWDVFLWVVLGCLFVGWAASRLLPVLTLICALIPLMMGVTACLAYMFIDLERYEVARGYKAVHNPLKGQELAQHLVLYGHQVRVPLLIAASVGAIGGFAMLNFGLYQTIGRGWYAVGVNQPAPTFVDFLANALIILLRIVDVLDFASSNHLLAVTYVRQAKWPSALLLSVFKMFFTVVLLQQIFASIRQGSLLSETITDLWNPHEPIHERARNALPQYGPAAVGPLLVSLGSITSLTKEQREQLPPILAAIGPGAIPALVRHLHDPHDHVRAIAVATLGHLHARHTLHLFAQLSQDPSDVVRQSVVDALGIISVTESHVEHKLAPAPAAVLMRPAHHGLWRLFRWRTRQDVVTQSDPIKLAVKTLQTSLSDELPSVRTQAARALGRIGLPAAASAFPLIGVLQDEHESVRLEATKALGRVGGPKTATVNALIDLLQDVSPSVKAAAARALGSFEETAERAIPDLVLLLQDRDEFVRTAVAEAIGQIGPLDEAATDQLVQGLNSPDNIVRAQTAEALGTIGESAQETAAALVEALTDGIDMVRAKAVEALGKIGESAAEIAVPALVLALRDHDNTVCALAAEALGQMGRSAEETVPNLIQLLSHINPQVRASVAESLGKLGRNSPMARTNLEQACRDDDAGVRSQSLRALGQMGCPTTSSKQTVLESLQDIDGPVRSAAVDALGAWGDLDEISLPRLLELLQDPNDEVKVQVARALPRCAGDTDAAVEGLCRQLLEDTSDMVQVQAAWALGEIGPAAAAAGPALVQASQTGEISVREQAMRAIALILPPESISTLVAGLKDPNSVIRKVASEGLLKAAAIPPEIVPDLIDALNDPEVLVRTNAVQVLSRLNPIPSAAIPLLVACADDSDESLRNTAVRVLKLAPEATVNKVMKHLAEDSDSNVDGQK
ncbi:MAG: repeat-containing protein [Planctomycetaceae bacterium]|nr:repeat-containing protein [Planctomycetaceae bacterium]